MVARQIGVCLLVLPVSSLPGWVLAGQSGLIGWLFGLLALGSCLFASPFCAFPLEANLLRNAAAFPY